MKTKVRLRDVLLGLYPTPLWLAQALRRLEREDVETLMAWASAPTETSGRAQCGRRRGSSEWQLRVQLAHALRELGLSVVIGHMCEVRVGCTVVRTKDSPRFMRPQVQYRISDLALLLDRTYWSVISDLRRSHVPIRRGWVYSADLAQRTPWLWESMCIVYGWTDAFAGLTSPMVAV